jgi:excisionase family DNA binding protein
MAVDGTADRRERAPYGSTTGHRADSGAGPDDLLLPSEVAAMFRVSPKTVRRWAETGALPSVRTMGGHRRYRRSEVERLIAEGEERSG